MDSLVILGLLAGVLTTISFLPQVLRIWKLKETRDISLWMYIILCTGIALWLVYGLYKNDLPIIIANGISLILTSSIVVLKLKYK